jgi:glycerophosphoryl diester phosphodiesterase
MELADLSELDFTSRASWLALDDEAPEVDDGSRRVLTLHRLLETARDYDRPIDLAIETKHPTRYAGLVERRLVDLLDSLGYVGPRSPARVMSFSPVALTRVKKLAPHLEVVLLIDRQYSWQMALGVLGTGWIAGPGIDLLRENPRLARRLGRNGQRVHVWTVNTPEDLDLCLSAGVEAVITDDPRSALAHLGGPAGRARLR